MTHPTQRLDNAVHQRTRLGILTVLAGTKRADFTFLRNTLELTDGNLSRNITVLETSGHVVVNKESDGRRTRTWIAVTATGRKALADEISALREVVQSFDQSTDTTQRASRTRPAVP